MTDFIDKIIRNRALAIANKFDVNQENNQMLEKLHKAIVSELKDPNLILEYEALTNKIHNQIYIEIYRQGFKEGAKIAMKYLK
jgi:hypothetical protein